MSAWGKRETENAVIESVRLGFHDGYGSIPTAWIDLRFDCGGQGFGGYHLGGKAAYVFIYGVLNALECESWEALKGKPCRVDHDSSKVYRLGHYIKDRWFDAAEAMKTINPEAPDAR